MIKNDHIITESYLLYLNDFDLLKEGFLIESLTFDKIKSSFTSNLSKIEDILKSYVDVSKVKAKAKQLSVDMKNEFKKGISSEEMGKKLTKLVSKEILSFIEPLKKKIIEKVSTLSTVKKILFSIIGLIIIVFLNTFMLNVAYIFTGSRYTAAIISMTIIAPITEEALKNYFIMKGMPWTGTAVVFGFELITYVIQLVNLGMSLPRALIARAITLLFHFSTTWIQKTIIDRYTIDGKVDTDVVFRAWFIGALCHCAFNTLAIVSLS